MDPSSGLRLDHLDKLRDDNFHIWKARIQLVLSLKDVESHLTDDPPDETSGTYVAWQKADAKARAIIGLTLSDTHLEQVQHASTAKQMWKLICDIFEKHTLLNKLAARRKFYTAKMNENEKVLVFAARVRQLAATLKSMSVVVEDSEMAMALLNGLPDRFDSLISALDAANIDEQKFTFDFVQSRCVQEEQRHAQRDLDALKSSESAALFARKPGKTNRYTSAETCVHCGKHKDSSRCYKKFPHLAPVGHPARTHLDKPTSAGNKGLVATRISEPSDSEDHFAVCLFSNTTSQNPALKSLTGTGPPVSNWIIDSGCTSHVTYNRTSFISYKPLSSPGTLDLGANSHAEIVGTGDICISLNLNGSASRCLIQNVLHVPKLRYQLVSVSSMEKRGIRTQLDEHNGALIRKSDLSTVATITQTKGLYHLDVLNDFPQVQVIPKISLMASISTWHQRLARVNIAGIKSMVENGVVNGINIAKSNSSTSCEGCILGKAHRTPIPKTTTSRASKPLQLVHSDVLGPVEVPSLGGARYFVSFIDDYSKWTTVYTMSHKSKVLDRFKHYQAAAEKHAKKELRRCTFMSSMDQARFKPMTIFFSKHFAPTMAGNISPTNSKRSYRNMVYSTNLQLPIRHSKMGWQSA